MSHKGRARHPPGQGEDDALKGQGKGSTRPAVMPLAISDATSLETVGLTPRQFRDWLKQSNAVPYTRIGRRLVARADRVLEAIDRLAGAEPLPHWDEDEVVARAAGRGNR